MEPVYIVISSALIVILIIIIFAIISMALFYNSNKRLISENLRLSELLAARDYPEFKKQELKADVVHNQIESSRRRLDLLNKKLKVKKKKEPGKSVSVDVKPGQIVKTPGIDDGSSKQS